jgi:Fe2+ transport system protein FeoA
MNMVSLTELEPGTNASVVLVDSQSQARLNRLASFGIVPGTRLRLVSRRPAMVIACGASTVAVEEAIGREIFVVPVQ